MANIQSLSVCQSVYESRVVEWAEIRQRRNRTALNGYKQN